MDRGDLGTRDLGRRRASDLPHARARPAREFVQLYGAAYGLLPIGWIVFTALLLYRLTLETGKFEIIKDSIGSLTGDQRVQALLIAFAFGAFIEGAAGFGTPVAVAAAMLAGLGFRPFFAASLCLLANTSPVAFGSIGTPLIMLATVTGLPLGPLSANVGRICAPVSLIRSRVSGIGHGRTQRTCAASRLRPPCVESRSLARSSWCRAISART